MACRRAYISNIQSTLKAPQAVIAPKETTVITGNVVTKTETQTTTTNVEVPRDNISKRVLREAMDKVGGAVERIDNPLELGISSACAA